MTREEAITNLNMISVAFVEPITKEQRKLIDDTFDMAIKALEQEPCEDCISRAEAIDALGYDISIESDEGLDAYKTVIKEMLCKIYDVQKENIEKLPSVQPKPKTECSCEQIKWERDVAIEQLKELGYGLGEKPKTGHWIEVGLEDFMCSECRMSGNPHESDYCPDCGAKMLPTDSESEDTE